MFSRIAARYDLLNCLMTFAQDQVWRREVVRMAALDGAGRLLDIGAGTGRIALAAQTRWPALHIVAADFALPMMQVGRKRSGAKHIAWCAADALRLPFSERTFDAVTSGYLLRNVIDPLQALKEQLRVVKPGGRVVCLDTTPPPDNCLGAFVMIHLKFVIPFLGRWIAGSRQAYTYLPDSTRTFMKPAQLALLMQRAGLVDVVYRQYMLGTIAIHRGTRP